MTELDWKRAEEYLKEVRRQYCEIGMAGIPGLRISIDPLLVRFERGERTQELHSEIMGLK